MDVDQLSIGHFFGFVNRECDRTEKVRIKEIRNDKATGYRTECLITFLGAKDRTDAWVVADGYNFVDFSVFTSKQFGEQQQFLDSSEALRRHTVLNPGDVTPVAVLEKNSSCDNVCPESEVEETASDIDHTSLIKLPHSLVQVLLEDFEAVCVQNKWLRLPLEYSIRKICKEYIKYIALVKKDLLGEVEVKRNVDFARKLPDIIDEVFDKDVNMIYGKEHAYFEEALATTKGPADCLGLAHLLRVIIKIADPLIEDARSFNQKHMLEHKKINEELFSSLVAFLDENKECLFNVDYDYCLR